MLLVKSLLDFSTRRDRKIGVCNVVGMQHADEKLVGIPRTDFILQDYNSAADRKYQRGREVTSERKTESSSQ